MLFVTRFFITTVVFISTYLIAVAEASAQTPRIVVSVGDTAFVAGSRSNYLSIRVSNYVDSIGGVGLRLRTERPDLVTFDFSGAGFDSTSTLISGWEYLFVIDSTHNGVHWRIAAAADFYPDQNRPSPIPPQSGGLVVRVPIITPHNPDTSQPLIAPITLYGMQEFSTPVGQLIGVVTDTVVDTSYFACRSWIGDSCSVWVQVDPSAEPYDSVAYDSSLVGYVDTSVVVPVHGSVTLIPSKQCDITADNMLDLSDLICLVNHLFLGQSGSDCIGIDYCDADGSGTTDLSDLIALVNYLFMGGSPPQG